MQSILGKVQRLSRHSISEVITGAVSYRFSEVVRQEHPECVAFIEKNFDLRTNVFDKLHGKLFFNQPKGKDWVRIFGLLDKECTYLWIDRKYLITPPVFEKWKVFVPEANGSGTLGGIRPTQILCKPLISKPFIGSTQTFISIGCFKAREEAEACFKYVKTKFARAILGILKVTQHNPRATWAYVPLQDFTSGSYIDWGVSVAEVDAQLYGKYGLSAEEVAFIEGKVREMA